MKIIDIIFNAIFAIELAIKPQDTPVRPEISLFGMHIQVNKSL